MIRSLFSATACLLLPLSEAVHLQLTNSAAVSAGQPVLPSFVSYSIEFSSFPDFAGNLSSPNTFSNNLLENIKALTGTKPLIRVGGNTQDYALFDPNLMVATNGTYTSASQDYPTILYIGKAYFESYRTWPGTQFIHGFNLAANGTIGYNNLVATVPLACQALRNGSLAYWELGNEPDLYKTSAQGIKRPSTWTEPDYVSEWLNKTHIIQQLVTTTCPEETYGYYAPSFAGTKNSLDPIRTWNAGLDTDNDIRLISSHNYIGGATQPGVTLQKTLMNHTSTVNSIASQLNESNLLSSYNLPFILGETNSLYNEGAPGLSNSFGAALWGVDFNLWCASQSIRRVHMHQGTNYRYASWQPIQTSKATKGTKAPYYGNIAVAAMLGDLTTANTSIVNLPLANELQAAYAAYSNGALVRLAVINMVQYNYTTTTPTRPPRPSTTYTFQLPEYFGTNVTIQRLLANGSDAITGITWDGTSYNYELNEGKPVVLKNVTRGETAQVASNGNVTVVVPDSSAAIIRLGGY